jgi:hypothetical protein
VRTTRALRAVVLALGVAGGGVSAVACNALVGNKDIEIADDGGNDATTTMDADHADGPSAAEGASEQPDAGGVTMDLPDADAAAGCPPGTKLCAGTCVGFDLPGYGCGPKRCTPCDLNHAGAGCAPPDGGAPDADLACSVLGCVKGTADCNGNPLDGCEVDTSSDVFNCGACGHDCSDLKNVPGNVTCVGGVCTFDGGACAPGYAICTTNPDNGCDTAISQQSSCGGCTTSCPATMPYCSATPAAATPFTCTSGCAAGLSLCVNQCVDEHSDPQHCGDCLTMCPAIAGGSPTCSAAGCSFTCNANDHRCGTGANATCAANNDATHCQLGAACGACTAPANASATCTNGTTCGSVCNPEAHSCNGACVLDSDPNNCGSACGTNCPGPTRGTGTAACDGNACTLACAGTQSVCATGCVDESTDSANCGACGNTCAGGQRCSGGKCLCDATSCLNGCCDASGTCRPAACGTGGGACATGCPATIPEAADLLLWLVGDTYDAGAPSWSDLSGHADATCTTCPTVSSGGPNGHAALTFDGSSYFTLGDPLAQYLTQGWTILVVVAPDPAATSAAQILGFASGANAVGLLRSGGSSDLLFQVLPGSSTNSLAAAGAWGGAWERITAGVDATQNGFLTVGTSTVQGAIGAPAAVDYSSATLGIDPETLTLGYKGQLAEVLVFDTTNVPSLAAIQGYLATRYALP